MTYAGFPIGCQLITKTSWKCNTDLFGPVCQHWSATFKCMRDSEPQRCIQEHKPLNPTPKTTKGNKHKNETSKSTFAYNLFKTANKHTQGMFSNRMICFNALKSKNYDEFQKL